MKITGQIEKWGAGALGTASLVLVAILMLHHHDEGQKMAKPRGEAKVHARASASAAPASKAGRGNQKVDELSRYNPHVALDLLREFDSRPLLQLKRSPFDFGDLPVPVSPVLTAAATLPVAELAPAPPPPPPPPMTVKPMGYSLVNGKVKGAIVSDEDQIYVVNEGGSVGSRYRVTGITPTTITIEDTNPQRTVDLPIPK